MPQRLPHALVNLLKRHFRLKGYLGSMWISIEHWVMVSGIVYVFLGLWFMIGHAQSSLLITGGGPLGHRQL